uniref:Death domain containing 1 n=1 Tax=Labrus bergylta TaxID=56723 RepID=A0A3Q3H2Z2_9LABR
LCSDSLTDTFLSVEEDIKNIMDNLNTIILKLDKEILNSCDDEVAARQETRDPEASEQPEDDSNPSQDDLELDSGIKQDMEAEDNQRKTMPSPEAVQNSDIRVSSLDCIVVEGTVGELAVKSLGSGNEDLDSNSDVPDACFIKAPMGVAELLTCEVADALSCLMVTGSEELVSRVIWVTTQNGANFHFPVILVLPFCAHYRGSYRDVAVKMVDRERRASYVTPVTTEGTYGGQRGSFAEVKVYSLGLFAVVSCLKRENYTILRKGLSLKLSMDPRICLNYLPDPSLTSVFFLPQIQPIDAVLLAAIKSRNDVYHSVVSTSPILYLTHPSSQPLRRPLTLTLPCPPNLEKKRKGRGQLEEQDQQIWPVSASPMWEQSASHRKIILGTSVKSKEMSNELLVVLGSRDKQWSVLDEVTARNQQNGLVSFELLVVRLLSPLQPCHLVSLAEELEESVSCHAVTVILQRRPDEPHAVLVAALPSRDLSWELSKLKVQGYSGLLETSSEMSMCEGDQLLLRFSGNITSKGTHKDEQRLTFHSQQKNHLLLHLSEVDPFGNYSSPHYKGTAVIYNVTRGQLEVIQEAYSLPIPFLFSFLSPADSLSDSLLLWLSEELSEEEVSLLVLSLRLRRSAAQLVKLRAGGGLSSQAFHILAMWRRGLPAATRKPKASQLAHCLAKSGRPDLARELLLRQSEASRPGLLRQGSLKSRNEAAF